ncbi:MAG: AzlC family ABC transporter permease [Ramlibacter sp.]|nr:AzlC family ABC transporter permease [Ramlibacter sp.]
MNPNHHGARAAFLEGVRGTLLIVPSYLPFAVICGVASVNAGLSTSAALALPALVFGGSSQAVLTQFLQSASSLWIAVLSGLVVNLRMAVYSAAMAPKLRHLPPGKRMLVAAFLVDNLFAFLQQREQERPGDPHLLSYYAGMTAILWPSWALFCAIGVLAGNIIPASWQLDFAIPLSFIAILATSVRGMPMLAAAVSGGVASVVLFALPLKLGLIAACLLGLAAGLLIEKLMGQSAEATP